MYVGLQIYLSQSHSSAEKAADAIAKTGQWLQPALHLACLAAIRQGTAYCRVSAQPHVHMVRVQENVNKVIEAAN